MESCVTTSVTFVCGHVSFFKDRQAFDCLNSCCLSFRICQAEEKVLKGQSLFARVQLVILDTHLERRDGNPELLLVDNLRAFICMFMASGYSMVYWLIQINN